MFTTLKALTKHQIKIKHVTHALSMLVSCHASHLHCVIMLLRVSSQGLPEQLITSD